MLFFKKHSFTTVCSVPASQMKIVCVICVCIPIFIHTFIYINIKMF